MDQSRDQSDLTGREVSHFRVLEPLGAGGMGVVYRAEDLRLHRTVALKFMRPDYTLDDTATARFLREARSVAALDHPNICTVHEVGESEDGQLFLAMSYYPGETLRERLTKHGALPLHEALDIAVQITRGLAAAHGAGIIHRDLKPANVILTAGGAVKILDFGLAKARDQTMTATGAVMGTVAYMSPEQLVGDAVDARSDLYSLGVVLFEMLTGRHPSRSDDATGTLTRNLATRPEPVRRESSAALAGLLQRLLRKDSARRYQTADELAKDLTALRDQVASPLASRPRSGLTRRRIVGGATAALILIAAALGLFRWRQPSGPASNTIPGTGAASDAFTWLAVLPLKNNSPPDKDYLADAMTEELTTTLTKIEALRVIAHQSMLRFKGTTRSATEIARDVKVRYLVSGSVQQSANAVRVSASLIDSSTNSSIWTESFVEPLQDVMSLQQKVALAIARQIEVRLTPQDQARLANPKKVDPVAYELYAQGTRARYAANFTGDFRESTRLFDASIARDSTFADPYAGLAFNYAFSLDETRARSMANKAIALDPKLADAYVARSVIKQFFEWDWKGAEEAVRTAIEVNPGHAEAHHELSMLWSRLGRYEEALSEAVLALRHNPLSLRFENGLAEVHGFGGESEKALEIADEIARKDSTFLGSYFVRIVVYLQLGRYDEAEKAWLRCNQINPGGCSFPGELAYIYGKTGRRADASKLIDSLRTVWHETRGSRSAWGIAESIAAAYAGLGERDSALTWLERAAELRTQMLYVKVHPTFASLRSETRYRRLLERMGFPDNQETVPATSR
jgi:serine/threonine protein kinase/Flp pilus assembly protein TadD